MEERGAWIPWGLLLPWKEVGPAEWPPQSPHTMLNGFTQWIRGEWLSCRSEDPPGGALSNFPAPHPLAHTLAWNSLGVSLENLEPWKSGSSRPLRVYCSPGAAFLDKSPISCIRLGYVSDSLGCKARRTSGPREDCPKEGEDGCSGSVRRWPHSPPWAVCSPVPSPLPAPQTLPPAAVAPRLAPRHVPEDAPVRRRAGLARGWWQQWRRRGAPGPALDCPAHPQRPSRSGMGGVQFGSAPHPPFPWQQQASFSAYCNLQVTGILARRTRWVWDAKFSRVTPELAPFNPALTSQPLRFGEIGAREPEVHLGVLGGSHLSLWRQ